jgi:hypothetical protein
VSAPTPRARQSDRVCVVTQNLRGGLLPSGAGPEGRGDNGKLAFVNGLLNSTEIDERPDFVCAQEVGLAGTAIPVVITDMLEPNGHSVYLVGGADASGASVATFVRSGWIVLRVLSDPVHSRALGLELERADGSGPRFLLINLYIPTGLDQATANSTDADTARYLYELVTAWIVETGLPDFLICGDLNETVTGGTQRERVFRRVGGVRHSAVRHVRASSVLQTSLLKLGDADEALGCVDLYDCLHPLAPLEDRFTRSQPCKGGVSAARLDYMILCARTFDRAVAAGRVAEITCETREFGISDHLSVWATFPLMAPSQAPLSEPFAGDVTIPMPAPLLAQNLNAGQKRACAYAVERAIAPLIDGWLARLGACPLPPPAHADNPRPAAHELFSSARILGEVQLEIVETITEATRPILRSRMTDDGGKKDTLDPLRRRVRVLNGAVVAIKRRLMGIGGWNSNSWGRVTAQLTGLGVLGEAPVNPMGWAQWSDLVATPELESARQDLEQATSSLGRRHARSRKVLATTDPAERGRLLGRAFQRSTTGHGSGNGIASALLTAPDGSTSRSQDPAVYVPRVRELASLPFSVQWEPPPFDPSVWSLAPCKGKCRPDGRPATRPAMGNCYDSRCTGCKPPWWTLRYQPKPHIDEEAYADLMSAATPEVIRRLILTAAGHKSAGLDRLPIDLLHILADGDHLLEVGADNTVGSGRNGPRPMITSAVAALTMITNFALAHRCSSEADNHCWTALIPKPDGSGGYTRDADKMRPLMISSELFKLRSRLLADRLGRALMDHPEILNESQRGFLKEGGCEQCVDVVLDVFEDFQAHKKGLPGASLHALFYDQSKAYDSVQRFSLQASLRRLRLPESFVQYVMSAFDKTRSSVRTKHGLTASYEVRSGVRQGDPLAPLLYLCYLDPLLDGLADDNPFLEAGSSQPGYRFSNYDSEVVAASAYADDTTVLSESAKETFAQHHFVRAWLGANLGKINADKCEYLLSAGSAPAARLLSVDGCRAIHPQPPSTAPRLLGVYPTMGLDWTKQLEMMDTKVRIFCAQLRSNQFDLSLSAEAVNTVLLPRLEAGLRVLPLSVSVKSMVARWDTSIFRAVLAGTPELTGDRWKRVGTPREAICLMLDLRLPSTMHWIMRTTEAGVRLNGMLALPTEDGHLNAHPLRSCRTAWLRLAALTRTPLPAPAHASPQSTAIIKCISEKGAYYVNHRNNRWASLLRAMAQHRVVLQANPDPWHASHTRMSAAEPGPSEIVMGEPYATYRTPHPPGTAFAGPVKATSVFICDAPRLSRLAPCAPAPCSSSDPAIWYTDGSTSKDGGFPFSGYAAVCSDSRVGGGLGKICVIGAVRGKGNNHTTECNGITVPAKLTPLNLDVLMGTDSLANVWCLQGARHPELRRGLQLKRLTSRRRNRIAPRALVMSYNKTSRFRWAQYGSTSRLFWVRAHTGRLDRHSLGNAEADHGTHIALDRSKRLGKGLQDVLHDDETVIFGHSPQCWDADGRAYVPKPRYINGDVRKALLRHYRADLLHAWCQRGGSTGELARQYANTLISHCASVRKARHPRGLLTSILFLTQSLILPQPPDRRRFGSAAAEDVLICPLCHSGSRADARHVLECDAMRDVVRDAVSRANASLELPHYRPLSSLPARNLRTVARGWATTLAGSGPCNVSHPHAALLADEFVNALGTTMDNAAGPASRLPLADSQLRPTLTQALMATAELSRGLAPAGLPALMVRAFSRYLSLSTEAFASEGTRSTYFHRRIVPAGSPSIPIGASAVPLLEMQWEGMNIWAHPPVSSPDSLFVRLIQRAHESLRSISPVRLVLVVPERATLLAHCATVQHVDAVECFHKLCLARFLPLGGKGPAWRVMLMVNDASLLADPVKWDLLATKVCSVASRFALPLLPESVLGTNFDPYTLPPPNCDHTLYTAEHGFIDAPPTGLWDGRAMPSTTSAAAPSGLCAAAHWFDPAETTIGLPLLPIGHLRKSGMYAAYVEQRRFDRLAGFVGLLPSKAQLLLRWLQPNETTWCTQKELDELCARLLYCLLSGASGLLAAYLSRVSAWLMHAATRDVVLTMAQAGPSHPRQPRRAQRDADPSSAPSHGGRTGGHGRKRSRTAPGQMEPPTGTRRRAPHTCRGTGPAAGTRGATQGRASLLASFFRTDSNTSSGRTQFAWCPTEDAACLWMDFQHKRWRHVRAVARQLCLHLPSNPGYHYWVDGW